MKNPSPDTHRLDHALWIAMRFMIFGLGGLAVLLSSTCAFGLFLSGAKIPTIIPWLSLPLTFAAALMMLFGTGKWGQWFYLLIFLSIPCTLWMLIAASGPGSGKGEVFFVLIVVALGLCALTRGWEAARAKQSRGKRNEEPPKDD